MYTWGSCINANSDSGGMGGDRDSAFLTSSQVTIGCSPYCGEEGAKKIPSFSMKHPLLQLWLSSTPPEPKATVSQLGKGQNTVVLRAEHGPWSQTDMNSNFSSATYVTQDKSFNLSTPEFPPLSNSDSIYLIERLSRLKIMQPGIQSTASTRWSLCFNSSNN